jgi:hypothetical protein
VDIKPTKRPKLHENTYLFILALYKERDKVFSYWLIVSPDRENRSCVFRFDAGRAVICRKIISFSSTVTFLEALRRVFVIN